MAKPLAGAWYGRSPDHYVTRGADVIHRDGGWWARCNRRVRGPLSTLDAAISAADRMVADAAMAPTERVIEGAPL